MKTKKRFFTLMLALALAVCMAVPAFASNEDSNFMIPIASNYTWGANEVSVRKKDNSTSAYVNYNIPTSPIGLLSVLTAHPAALVLGMTVPARFMVPQHLGALRR